MHPRRLNRKQYYHCGAKIKEKQLQNDANLTADIKILLRKESLMNRSAIKIFHFNKMENFNLYFKEYKSEYLNTCWIFASACFI